MGVQINGATGNVIATKGTFSGNVGIAGTLTYEDVTDIDAVGLITARSGIEVGASPGVGASISRQGNAIFSGITTIGSKEVGAGITLSPDGDVFFTGIITGNGSGLTNLATDLVNDTTPQLGGALDTNDKSIAFGDSNNDATASGTLNRLKFGAGTDMVLYHNGTDNFIKNPNGNFKIFTSSDKQSLIAKPDGAVELYHNDNKKLETTSTGVTVTGAASATSFSGIGAITMFDTWGLSGSTTYASNNYITNDWVRRTGTHGGNIGNAMTESSGVFTFPQTGFYYISMQFGGYTSAGTQPYFGVKLTLSTDGGSSYSNVSNYYTSMQNSQYGRLSCQEVIDVTDASQFKIKFQLEVAANISIQGGQGRTSVFFIRYGDT